MISVGEHPQLQRQRAALAPIHRKSKHGRTLLLAYYTLKVIFIRKFSPFSA